MNIFSQNINLSKYPLWSVNAINFSEKSVFSNHANMKKYWMKFISWIRIRIKMNKILRTNIINIFQANVSTYSVSLRCIKMLYLEILSSKPRLYYIDKELKRYRAISTKFGKNTNSHFRINDKLNSNQKTLQAMCTVLWELITIFDIHLSNNCNTFKYFHYRRDITFQYILSSQMYSIFWITFWFYK